MPRRPGSSPAAALAAAAAVLLTAASAVAPAAARAASFVVETGSMRIRQPQEIAGSFDSAIGDVSGPRAGGWVVPGGRLFVPGMGGWLRCLLKSTGHPSLSLPPLNVLPVG